MSKTIKWTDLHSVYLDDYSTSRYGIKAIPFMGDVTGPEYKGQKEGDMITVLKDYELHEIVMSDSRMERRTNTRLIKQGTGHVLIAGLGLGMVLFPLQEKKEITKITVVERSLELIGLIKTAIGDKLSDKIEIVHSDIFEYETDEKYDLIYFDIWNTVDAFNFHEMVKLRKQFKGNLIDSSKEKNIFSWREDDCRYLDALLGTTQH